MNKKEVFKDRLDSLMKQRNKNLKDISNATGIPYTTLYSSYIGRSFPKAEVLVKLTRYFNVPVDYFMEEAMQEFTLKELIPQSTNQLSDWQFLKAFHEAPENVQKAILALLGMNE